LDVAAEASVPLLEFTDVRAAYDGIEALHGVDFAIEKGHVFALLGPNGAGKSTTLAVASGLVTPTAGEVRYAGRNVVGVAAEDLVHAGLVSIPEGRGVFPNLTVRENLRMATYGGQSLRHIEEITYERFPRLKERRHQMSGTMSGGEQQMLAMSRALACDPAVLLLDEISMGLAPLVVEELYGLVRQIATTGVTIMIVEQFARTVLGVADVAAIMVHGKVRRIGTPAEIESALAATYLGAT
jgi:branched-chain amino acid transport system ATP-binding protein